MTLKCRPIRISDKKNIVKLGFQSFGFLGALIVGLESGGYVVEAGGDNAEIPEGEIIGAIILKKFSFKKRKFGLVSWIITHSKARGMGIASELMRLGDEWFSKEEIDETFAVIEHYNQSSSKLFVSKGYNPLTLTKQFNLFGFETLLVWLKTQFIVSLSHVLWYRNNKDLRSSLENNNTVNSKDLKSKESDTKDNINKSSNKGEELRSFPKFGFLKAFGFQAVIIFILMFRVAVPLNFTEIMVSAMTISLIILLVRSVPFWVITRLLGLKTYYSAWLGGACLVLGLSAVSGWFIPFPGSLYPKQAQYSYKKVSPIIGFGSFMGAIGLLILLLCTRLISLDPNLPEWIIVSYEILKPVTLFYAITDILIPTFPLSGYLGRQIFLWKPLLWLVLAITGTGLIVLL